MAAQMSGALARYRVMALLVGTGLLVLCAIGMPLQYIGSDRTVVAVVGPIHGFLYLVYLVAAYDLARRARFSLLQLAAMIGAGLVPFLAFVVERRVVRRVRAAVEAGEIGPAGIIPRLSGLTGRTRDADSSGWLSTLRSTSLPGPALSGSGRPGEGELVHLALAGNWAEARRQGDYRRSTVDQHLDEVGFIHASYPEQLRGTADRFYAGHPDVIALLIDPKLLHSELRVEEAGSPPSGFPHIYGPLNLDAVRQAVPCPLGADGRVDLSPLGL
jgi:integral membrane protein